MASRENFRKNLRFYMDQNCISQSELAKAVGVSKSTVTTWLSGKAYPRINVIQKLADVLECATDDLVIGKTDADLGAERISVEQRTLYNLVRKIKPENVKKAIVFLKMLEENDDVF